MTCSCELCGREVSEALCKTITIEGATLRVCPTCYSRLLKNKRNSVVSEQKTTLYHIRQGSSHELGRKWSRARIPKRILEEEFDVVPDYSKRIREARQRLGWSTRVLAEKVREKESVIKRIESGKLKPSIDLARRLEKVLHIKLLEPIVEEKTTPASVDKEDYFTIGDLIKINSEK